MKGTILLIEDDVDSRNVYEKVLRQDGFRVVCASDGQEALGKTRNEKFALILTDLKMPGVSGQKFIELLQQDTGSIPCPIIISSGFIDHKVISSLGGNGRIHFLPKPTTTKELLEKVNSLFGASSAKPKMDVRFVNPVLEATVYVIQTMTGFSVQVGKPMVKASGDPSGDISGIVGVVSSGFKGTISLSFKEAGFLVVLSKMLGADYKEIDDENKDAVAELLNIIFGRAKKTLNEQGMNIQPAIPTIIRGKGHSIDHQTRSPTIVIPFSSKEIGDFRVELSSMG
jgi:chemotaxis protein CheX